MKRAFFALFFSCLACGSSASSAPTPPADSAPDATTDSVATDAAKEVAPDAPADVPTDSTDSSTDTSVADTTDAPSGEVGLGGGCKVSSECSKGLACCRSCGAITCPMQCITPDPDGTCPKFP